MVNLKTAIRSSNSKNVSSLSLNVATRVDMVWPSVSNRYSKWWLSPLLVELVSRSVSLKMVYSCFTVSVVALDTGLCVCGGVGGGVHAWQRARLNNRQKSHDIITLCAVSKPGRPTSDETHRLNNLRFPSIYQLPFPVSIYIAQNRGISLTLPQWHTQLELFYV